MPKTPNFPIFHRNLTRRSVLQGLAASASAAALAPGLAHAAGEGLEDELIFACNGGILEDLFRAAGDSFTKATGVKVTYVIGTQMSHLAKIQVSKSSPDTDVVFSSGLSHAIGKGQDLFEKLDPALVTNAKDLYPNAVDPDDVGAMGSLTSIGMGYNTEKLNEIGMGTPTSWNDLWDPRLKGRVALCSFNVTWTQDFLVLIAKMNGGSEDNIQPGFDKIRELKEMGNLAYIPSTPAEMENLLTQNLAWANATASIRAYGLGDQGYPFTFLYPEEGASLYANWFDIIKGAPHPKAAQAFVNHMLTPEAQLIMARGWYGPTNKTVVLPEDLAEKAPYGAERIASLVPIDRAKLNQNLDAWADQWNREIESK